MRKELFIFTFFLLGIIFISSVRAQGPIEWTLGWDIDYIWEEVFGLDPSWLQPKLFIFNFLVPFIALFAVCLGFLKTLRIFESSRNIELVLAFAMAFMTLPSKLFATLVAWSLGLLGIWSYALFFVMFFFGALWYSQGFLAKKWTKSNIEQTYEQKDVELERKISDLNRDIGNVLMQLGTDKPLSDNVKQALEIQLDQLKHQVARLEAQKADLKRAYES